MIKLLKLTMQILMKKSNSYATLNNKETYNEVLYYISLFSSFSLHQIGLGFLDIQQPTHHPLSFLTKELVY